MVSRVAPLSLVVVGVVGCGFEPEPEGPPLPEVSFATERSVTDESVGTASINLRLSATSAEPVTVEFKVVDGNATRDEDYSLEVSQLTFPPGTDRAVIPLKIMDDGLDEDDENVRIVLHTAHGATIGSRLMHDLRISAFKLARLSFAAPESSAGEETGPQNFAVVLDKPSPVDVVLAYTWSGSAEAEDHGLVDGTLTIPANQASARIVTPINNDLIDEDPETIDVVLTALDGAIVASDQAALHIHTIIDDDPPPDIGFELATSTTSESTNAMLAVKLSRRSEKEITVAYAAAGGGTAGIDDFSVAPSTLTFPPGTTMLKVPVTITNDALDEDDETAIVQLMNPTNATLVRAQHVLTITDDDNPPSLSFEQSSSSVSEATPTHAITVKLSAPSGKPIQFSLTRSGTSSEADLSLPSLPLTIPAGMTSATLNLSITDDSLDEDNETAVLTLADLVNATPGSTKTHTVTIQDNDDPPAVRFDPNTPSRSALEGNSDTMYVYKVILSAPSTKQVSVGVTLSGDASNSDYDIGNGDIPVVFAPGETSKDIRVIVKGDNSHETNDDIVMTLRPATNATNASDNQSRTHTIINDD